jgi:hypothetical protein
MNELTEIAGVRAAAASASDPIVRHFRQIVLWPIQLFCESTEATGRHDSLLEKLQPNGLWTLVEDEFGEKGGDFQERHYREFVSFLPHVQRFLYGDAPGPVRQLGYGEAPLRVYRRQDVRQVRITLARGQAPVTCNVAHVDMYFYYDIDAAILVFELSADELPLTVAQEIMYRFGRAYPPGWSEAGVALNCPELVEWIGASGEVLARSDYQDRRRYVSFVGERRSPCIATHWEFLLRPMVPYASDESGTLRFRQIEYYRMPLMAYLTLDTLSNLGRADYARFALASGPGTTRGSLPYSERYLERFEQDYCYDRFFSGADRDTSLDTRIMTSGHALTIVSAGKSPSLTDNERGLLGQFRHQYFLLFMIAHFHKAALLMISDQLVATIKRLDPGKYASLVRFRRETFQLQESFLRFTQRYYFAEVSDQAHARDIFRMLRRHLGNDTLYEEVRSEIVDMVQYLDSNMLRRQSGSMHRLTIVTIVGLIGTIATGFLGMNLLAEADNPLSTKLLYFFATLGITTILTGLVVAASRPLTAFFDWMSGERDR